MTTALDLIVTDEAEDRSDGERVQPRHVLEDEIRLTGLRHARVEQPRDVRMRESSEQASLTFEPGLAAATRSGPLIHVSPGGIPVPCPSSVRPHVRGEPEEGIRGACHGTQADRRA